MPKIRLKHSPNLTDKDILSLLGASFNGHDVKPKKSENRSVEGVSVIISPLYVIQIMIKHKKDETEIDIDSWFNARSFWQYLFVGTMFLVLIFPGIILALFIHFLGRKHVTNIYNHLNSKLKEII
ncbi:MAG: hypothetical protein ACXACX_12295 [Candidatus Hodarchaeales archaeon]|jgi:hypothetical protein